MPATVARTASAKTPAAKENAPRKTKGRVRAGNTSCSTATLAGRAAPIWKTLPKGMRVAPAREGDHYAIHEFLQQAVHYPSDEEFAAQNERPGYQPMDRMLLLQDNDIVAHVLCSHRRMSFGGVEAPTVELSDLVTATQRREQGFGGYLLQQTMQHWSQNHGVVLGSLRTTNPAFYQRRGWTLGPRHSWSTACPRDVLSLLSPITSPASLQVRIWRQVEQAAIERLHEQACQQRVGQTCRTSDQWRWLVSRGVCDRVYVAVEGGPCLDDDATDAIVAFAFVQRGRIVELCAEPTREDACRELLRRVCYDAIESGEMEVRYDGPSDSSVHCFFKQAGGNQYHVDAECNLVKMVCVPSVERVLTQIVPVLEQRAETSQISRPSELGLAIESQGAVEKARIVVAKRSVQIAKGKVGRSYLTGEESDIHQLLLGRISLAEAIDQGRITPSTQTAVDLGTAMLPQLPLHRSALDELRPVRSANV